MGTVAVETKPNSEGDVAGKQLPIAAVDVPINSSNSSPMYFRSLSHISENSADGIVVPVGDSGEVMSLASGISINDIEMEVACRTPDPPNFADSDTAVDVTDQHPIKKHQNTSNSESMLAPLRTEGADPYAVESEDVTYIAHKVPVEEDLAATGSTEADGAVDSGLEDALGAVLSSIDDYRGPFPELHLLEQELKLLQVILKVRAKVTVLLKDLLLLTRKFFPF